MGDKDDLTRLEDLSEYIHEINEDIDSQLEDGSKARDGAPPPPPMDLDQLDDSSELFDSEQEESQDQAEEELSFASDELDSAEDDFSDNDSFESSDDFSSGDDFESSDDFSSGDDFESSDDFSSGDDFESSDDFSSGDDFQSSDEFSADVESDDETIADFQIDSDDFESTAQFTDQDSETEQEFDTQADEFEDSETSDNEEIETSEQTFYEPEDETPDGPIDEPFEDQIEESSFSATPTPDVAQVAQETFKDIRSFAKHISYGQVTRGGEPPFTLLIRNINYTDDVEDIKILLKEFGLYTDDNASLIDQSLMQGALILPQLSEFAAIFLANKLRRFSGDIQLGLSDEVHPAKGVNKKFKGLVSKENLLRNMKRSKKSYREDFTKDSIIITTTPQVEGHIIDEYVGIISADVTIDEKYLHDQGIIDDDQRDEASQSEQEQLLTQMLSHFSIGPTAYYQQLIEELKLKAYKQGANAVVGLSYALTPLIDFESKSSSGKYKIVATASAVTLSQKDS